MSLTPAAIYQSFIGTGGNFTAGIVDTGGKFTAGVTAISDTADKFSAGVNSIDGQFAAGINNTGSPPGVAMTWFLGKN